MSTIRLCHIPLRAFCVALFAVAVCSQPLFAQTDGNAADQQGESAAAAPEGEQPDSVSADADEADAEEVQGLDQKIDEAFGDATGWYVSGIFAGVPIMEGVSVPWVLFPLVFGAIFFTLYFGFPNLRHFGTAINIVRGKYEDLEEGGSTTISEESVSSVDGDNPDTIRIEGHDGEVSHFQALTAALSGTVGLGNIAGVAIALSLGGPGATLWMIICGLLGMSSKFVECTLGVAYREVDDNGVVFGGPIYYLSKGLKEKGFGAVGKVLAFMFAIMCVGGSFGGGNMFLSLIHI